MALKIGVTQRVVKDTATGEVRDSLDQRWTQILTGLGYLIVPIPNQIADVHSYIRECSLDGVILSGGGDLSGYAAVGSESHDRENVERGIIEHALENDMPVLGVCRGFQAMAVYFGGRLTLISGHVRRDHDITVDPSFGDLFRHSRVNSYHDFGISESDLPDKLRATSRAEDGTIESAMLASGKFVGIMWHPEREEIAADADLFLIRRVFESDAE